MMRLPVAKARTDGQGTTLTLPSGVDVAEIQGDVMLPTYAPGTLVLVDRTTRRLTGEGLYFVHDGLGEVCRRISPGSRRGAWAVYQDNKTYSAYEATPDEIAITGRIVSVFQQV